MGRCSKRHSGVERRLPMRKLLSGSRKSCPLVLRGGTMRTAFVAVGLILVASAMITAQPPNPQDHADIPKWQRERQRHLISVIEADQVSSWVSYRAAEEL